MANPQDAWTRALVETPVKLADGGLVDVSEHGCHDYVSNR
jgi:hypothetical protein